MILVFTTKPFVKRHPKSGAWFTEKNRVNFAIAQFYLEFYGAKNILYIRDISKFKIWKCNFFILWSWKFYDTMKERYNFCLIQKKNIKPITAGKRFIDFKV